MEESKPKGGFRDALQKKFQRVGKQAKNKEEAELKIKKGKQINDEKQKEK